MFSKTFRKKFFELKNIDKENPLMKTFNDINANLSSAPSKNGFYSRTFIVQMIGSNFFFLISTLNDIEKIKTENMNY